MSTSQPQPAKEDRQDDFYFGPKISTQSSPLPSKDLHTSEKYVTLRGLSETDTPTLWKNLGTPDGDTSVFNYIPQLRQPTPEAFREVLHSLRDEHGIHPVRHQSGSKQTCPRRLHRRTSPISPNSHTEPLGLIAFLNIQPHHRALEIGAVLYKPNPAANSSSHRNAVSPSALRVRRRTLLIDSSSLTSLPPRSLEMQCPQQDF